MKAWKRNAVIATVLVFICAGVYLNWSYNQKEKTPELTQTLSADQVMGETTMVIADASDEAEPAANMDAADYFAQVRLSRQESRDSAVELLEETIAYDEGTAGRDTERPGELLLQRKLRGKQLFFHRTIAALAKLLCFFRRSCGTARFLAVYHADGDQRHIGKRRKERLRLWYAGRAGPDAAVVRARLAGVAKACRKAVFGKPAADGQRCRFYLCRIHDLHLPPRV